jgi:hypothetical protein
MLRLRSGRTIERKRRSQLLTSSSTKLLNVSDPDSVVTLSRASPTLLSGSSNSQACDKYDSALTCAGCTLAPYDSEEPVLDRYVLASQRSSKSITHGTYNSTWTHASYTPVIGDSEATTHDTYALGPLKKRCNRLSRARPTLLTGTSKLLAHDTYLSANKLAGTTLVTGDSEETGHNTFASASRFNDDDDHSDSSSQSNKTHLTTTSVSSGSIYLPNIDSDHDSTSKSASINSPSPKSSLAELQQTFNVLPSYDVDPVMYIAFEISDPNSKIKRGDVSRRLSLDRIRSGIIKYVLAIPIFIKTIYLKRDAHSDCHYGIWYSEMIEYMNEAKLHGVDVLVLDAGTHQNQEFIVMHGNDCALNKSFDKLVERCKSNLVTDQELTSDDTRNTMSGCYGIATGNYGRDETTQMNTPTVKLNRNKNVGITMVLLGELLNEVDTSGNFHKIDKRRQRNYAARIGIECGLSKSDCQKLYLEGMTYNKTDISLVDGGNDTVSPTPHCDENNGVDGGNNFLICISWIEKVSSKKLVRHVILGYMRRVVSQAIRRGILADSIETVVTQYLAELPSRRQKIQTVYLSNQMKKRQGRDELFILPCNMEKEAFYSLIVTTMSNYADHFNFGYFKRLELLSLLFIANGSDRIHTVLTTWMSKDFCPKGLLPCAFMSACCDMFGSTASEGQFARYQFCSTFGTTIDDWILTLVTLGRVCELANKGNMKYVYLFSFPYYSLLQCNSYNFFLRFIYYSKKDTTQRPL